MYEVLIREAAVRFGLGDKALPVLQMLLAYMTAKDSGGWLAFSKNSRLPGWGRSSSPGWAAGPAPSRSATASSRRCWAPAAACCR
jgi:hypothetical protein